MAKEYIAKESTSQAILTKATETGTAVDGIVGKVGETSDSSGSTTSGGIFAKLNKVITDTTSLLTRLTTARAASLDRIGTEGDSGGSATTGTLMAKVNTLIAKNEIQDIPVLKKESLESSASSSGGKYNHVFRSDGKKNVRMIYFSDTISDATKITLNVDGKEYISKSNATNLSGYLTYDLVGGVGTYFNAILPQNANSSVIVSFSCSNYFELTILCSNSSTRTISVFYE